MTLHDRFELSKQFQSAEYHVHALLRTYICISVQTWVLSYVISASACATAATMPFLAEEHIKIPNKDLLSWMFDDQKYDQDEPVGNMVIVQSHWLTFLRSTWMRRIHLAPFHHDKREVSPENYAQASNLSV